MRRALGTLLILLSTIVFNAPLAEGNVKGIREGASCTKVKQSKSNKGVTYSCVRVGKKLVWQKKVQQKQSQPESETPKNTSSKVETTAVPEASPTATKSSLPAPAPTLALGPTTAPPSDEIAIYDGQKPTPNKNIKKSFELNRLLSPSKPSSNLKLWIYDPENLNAQLGSPGIWSQKDGGEWLFTHSDRTDGSFDTKFDFGKYVIDIVEPNENRTKYDRGRYVVNVGPTGEVTFDGLLPNSQGYFTVTAVLKNSISKTQKLFTATSKCQLSDRTGAKNMSNGFPRAEGRLPNSGVVKALIIPVAFSDLQGSGKPASNYREMAKGTADFYYKQSQRTLRFEFTTLAEYVNLNVPVGQFKLGSYNDGDPYSFFMAGLKAVENIVDISDFDIAYVLPPPTVQTSQIAYGPAFPGNFNSNDYSNSTGRILNGSVGGADAWQNLPGAGWKWMAHETGHTFGLYDWYTLDGGDPYGPWDIMSSNWSTEAIELNSWNRYISGWLADSQVICLDKLEIGNNPKSFVIETLSVESDKQKSVMIKLSESKIIVIEVRATAGLDLLSPERTGVVVYTVDTSIPTIKGIATTHTPGGVREVRLAAFREGESVKVDGIQIQGGKRLNHDFEIFVSKL